MYLDSSIKLIVENLNKNEIDFIENDYMSKHTTFKIGGPARIITFPKTTSEIKTIVSCCSINKTPFFIIGNGSNLLVSDLGLNGVVIKLTKISDIIVKKNKIYCDAGALMSVIAVKALTAGLTGFEFAQGIPGTVGGGVCMNAGAYDGEMSKVVSKVKYINHMGEPFEVDGRQCNFSYRKSIFNDINSLDKKIITQAELTLEPGDETIIKEKMAGFSKSRRAKQPLSQPSAGSIFKRPVGYFAGKLIENSGLKGFQIGGAQVSTLHSGFIVNVGNATANDVLNLISRIQKTVFEKFGVNLECEVKYLKDQI